MYHNITVKTPSRTRVIRAEVVESAHLKHIGATEEQIGTYSNTDPLGIYRYDGLYYMRGVHESDFMDAEEVLDALQWMYEGEPEPQDFPDDI